METLESSEDFCAALSARKRAWNWSQCVWPWWLFVSVSFPSRAQWYHQWGKASANSWASTYSQWTPSETTTAFSSSTFHPAYQAKSLSLAPIPPEILINKQGEVFKALQLTICPATGLQGHVICGLKFPSSRSTCSASEVCGISPSYWGICHKGAKVIWTATIKPTAKQSLLSPKTFCHTIK